MHTTEQDGRDARMATAEPVLDCRELRRRAPQQVDQQPGAVQRAAGPVGTPSWSAT